MSSAFENFATGLLQGYSVHLQNDLDRRNKERAARLKAEIEAQLSNANIANVFRNHYQNEYGDIEPVDPAAEPTVITGQELHNHVAGNVYGTTAELISSGMSADDALQFARAEYDNQLDQLDRRKNAAATQAFIHMSEGDMESAAKAYVRAGNFNLDGMAYAISDQRGPNGEITIDYFDEDTKEHLGSTPLQAGLAETLMLKASAQPEFFAKRQKEARDEGRAAQRMSMDQEKHALRVTQDTQRSFGSNMDYLQDALIPANVPESDREYYVADLSPQEQQQHAVFSSIAQDMAATAAEMDQPPSSLTARHDVLRDANSRSLLNMKQDVLRINKAGADGGCWVGYKGKRFYAPRRVRDFLRALKAQMKP